MKKQFQRIYGILAAGTLMLLTACCLTAYQTPSRISVSPDSAASCFHFPFSVSYDERAVSIQSGDHSGVDGKVMLFGVIPVKDIRVNYTQRPMVRLGGQPFGIKLYTEGLVVARISEVSSARGLISPAKKAEIREGDTILSANEIPLKTNEQLMALVEQSNGCPIRITGSRDQKLYHTAITPVMDRQLDRYRIGLWVRDSCAGIGTLTFTDERTGTFAGLGHGITDSDSGSIMPLSKGEVVPAVIVSAEKGRGGCPGALCGSFTDSTPFGDIFANEDCGLYGALRTSIGQGQLIPVAFRQEVVKGPAQILTTVEGDTPALYEVEITDISYDNNNTAKNLVIRVTDEALLEKTGGIVQGMSGSPVLQNGRLAGAVTHVFINDPSCGYAIFAENMTEYNNSIIQKRAG